MVITGQRYWCTVCSEVHETIEGSNEYVTKTGWAFVTKEGIVHTSGDKLNIGFCNGAHSKDRAVHMHPERVMPPVYFEEK